MAKSTSPFLHHSTTTGTTAHMKQLLYRRSSSEKSHLYHQLLKKYYRWVLWFALSLSLFLSSSTPSFLPSPISRRSLSQTRTSSSPSSAPLSLKIYVYDLPPEFNRAWLTNPRCSSHLFAAEVAFHEALLHSSVRAINPFEADYFFVPVYVSCNFSTINGFPSLHHARPLLSSAVNLISMNFLPFWNRSNGADHIFVASHDYGACFHAMEDVAIADGIPEFLKNSILLQTFGMITPHACQEAEHVVIPPFISPKTGRWPSPETTNRDIFVFFRGKMEVHPKNISGRFYSRKLRTEIWNRYNGNRRFYLRRHRYDGYQSEIARSVFCLCPLGWAPWSPRIVESVALGCVPVIIADGIRLPFPEVVRWPEISVTVAERDVGSLESILDRIAATKLPAIQRRLWDPAIRRALLFNGHGIVEGDASWNVLRA
ncbi:LOW QUALITY PROTEIN: probable glucuronoxylan glucuronosyltransferase F8H [Phalaenopsis equestris]|uniref:LOW QUALITY PROTEIN: probable glucuronoxylan glucuronosyltransferase F8H n=1 Tax=Phalaenopsis equestris TaxID=78828 RepID=UPI0009E64EE8|nr:LOW QUALITY PROTEIN: probable glucuronoxylan glucuronosyltransferase F8H [Phalaenopsis equestris]